MEDKEKKDIYSNIFDEIKNRVSLVTEVESRGISLIPSGRQRLRCRCPLPGHNDSSPSFYISLNNDPELFHCFGCKRGGSVIDFVMYYGENGTSELPRKDAIKYIIKKYKLEDLSFFDIERIANIPNKYKREELPILSKSLLISEDIRSFLLKSFNLKSDFNKISDYIKNIDSSIFSSDYPNLNVLEDFVYNALKSLNNNDISSKFNMECKTCSLCDLRIYCKNSVFGFGNFNSNTFLVGEFITDEESRNNRPFSDDSGLFLIEEILKTGQDLLDLWLTVCQSCSSTKPILDFAKICSKTHLTKHIINAKPKNIITFGEISKEIISNFDFGYTNKVWNLCDYREIYLSGGIKSSKYYEFSESLSKIFIEK